MIEIKIVSDPNFRLKDNIGKRTRYAFIAQTVSKNKITFELLGCTQDFFKNWIKFQNTEDMTMGNYGSFWSFSSPLIFESFK